MAVALLFIGDQHAKASRIDTHQVAPLVLDAVYARTEAPTSDIDNHFCFFCCGGVTKMGS